MECLASCVAYMIAAIRYELNLVVVVGGGGVGGGVGGVGGVGGE